MYLGLKITSLYLEHFLCMQSGLKKDKLYLDLNHTKHMINVFIGKIGSCKTFILSHLQPFATVGTLDIRNQDDQIIEEKDGLKIICYESIDSVFKIQHEYKWSDKTKSHTIKSYFEKDGEELNPTGNATSFKFIILNEFGLEQNNLRLIRLGQNVSGFLEFTGTERKTYVASLLEAANAILAFNRSLREDLRNYNTKISIVSNKLNQIGVEKEEEYQSELESIQDRLSYLESNIREKEAKIIEYRTEISLVAPNGYEDLRREVNELGRYYDSLREEREKLQNIVFSLEGEDTVESLMKQIGGLENEKATIVELIQKTEDEYTNQEKILYKVEEEMRIIQNDSHIKMLREDHQKQIEELDIMQRKLKNFNCRYSSSYLKNLLTDLHSIDVLINDISQYDQDLVSKCYLSDSSIIQWARKKGDILTGKKVNLQKKINNISYSATYKVMGIMYLPPFCPTEDCPYRKTHPYTLADGKSKSEINKELEQIRNEIDQADRDLYVYAEIPTVYTKVSALKEKYHEMSPILRSLGALKETNLLQIITRIDHQVWYSYDHLVNMQELAIVKENYYEMLEESRKIEEELRRYESGDMKSLEEKHDLYKNKMNESLQILEEKTRRKKIVEEELQKAQEKYHQLLEKASTEEALEKMNQTLDVTSKELTQKIRSLDKISPYASHMEECKAKIHEMTIEKDQLTQKKTKFTTILSDLNYTKQEMKELLEEQKYLSLMVTATSSKEGIPLYMVNDFVKGCKDIANDLTFDIFEEDIVLEDFHIDEKEFFVPYSIDGTYIRDVTKASQGQRSLFTIAIAFAFVQKMGLPYNIPLLDEVDAPLHKPEQIKFLSMFLNQMKRTGSRQGFLITHNSLGSLPVNYIATTEEDVNLENGSTLIKLYE